MKAQDLRIGNLIVVNGNIEAVQSTDLLDMELFYPAPNKVRKPILLTEEWLLKLGSYKPMDNAWYQKYVFFNPKSTPINWLVKYWHSDSEKHKDNKGKFKWNKIDIKYVHQLQNLYFALTGEEIKIIEL